MNVESLKLEYPVQMGDSQKIRYEHNGIIFSQRTARGYTHLSFPFPLTEADFASLSSEDLYKLMRYVSHTDFSSVIEEAQRIQKLRTQVTTIHTDGFIYPTQEKPYTWPLREKIQLELERQVEMLKYIGISKIIVGLEIEFSCPEDAISGFTYWNDVKRIVLEELSMCRNASTSDLEWQHITDKIEQIKDFTAREILMYDLIERDTRTKTILEPLFGKSRDGDGYYDALGILELKTRQVDPFTSRINRTIVLQTLYDKAAVYGLELTHPNFHLNVSFWDECGNILDNAHPEFFTKGKAISEGITKAFYDNIFVLVRKNEIVSDQLVHFGLSADRQLLLRYSSKRIEVRPSIHGHLQDPDMIVTTLIAGALSGIYDQEKTDMLPAKKVVTPIVHHARDQYKVTSHLLNGSVIGEDGTIQIPDMYLNEHSYTIEYELGLTESAPDQSFASAIATAFITSDKLPFLRDFFGCVSVVRTHDGQAVIQFPTTSEGKYEFTTPSVNMDKIPKEYRIRLEQGEDVENMRSEISKYLDFGDHMPQVAKQYVIDVSELVDALTVIGVQSKFIVSGYDLNSTSNIAQVPDCWTRVAWARYQRMVTSICLQQGYTVDFFARLADLTKEVCKSDSQRDLLPLDPIDIHKQLFDKIKDRDWKIDTLSKRMRDLLTRNGMKEGIDFIKRPAIIAFDNVTNRDSFIEGLSGILNDINGARASYWYRMHKIGAYGVELEVEPTFIYLLTTIHKD